MNDGNKTLKVVLVFLAVLAIAGAVGRVLLYEPSARSGKKTVRTADNTTSAQPLTDLKRYELLEEPLARPVVIRGGAPGQVQPSVAASAPHTNAAQPHAVTAQPYVAKPTVKQPYPRRSPAFSAGGQVVNTNFYPSDPGQPAPVYPAYSGSKTTGPNVTWQDSMKAEREQILSPYLRPDRKQKEQMDARWANLSAAIDRAVAQALMPKSKKEKMLEKYAPASAAQVEMGGVTGPFAPVMSQIAAQRNAIVQNFADSFGERAANEAGNIMNSFASEMASALNAPGVSAEQAAKQVKEITQKYQQQMNKLAEKEQYNKFTQDRIAQDNAQKESLRQQYQDPALNEKFSQIIDAAREQDLALATQNLPASEYYKTLSLNQYNTHKKLEDAVVAAGQSTVPFHNWEKANTQKDLEKLKQQEEDGQIISVPQAQTQEQREGLQASLAKEANDMLQEVSKRYGAENAADFERILQNYQTKRLELAGEKLSQADRLEREQQITADFNRQLKELHLQKEEERISKSNMPKDQKQAYLEHLRQEYDAIQP